jgi:uncharacterized protein
MKGPLFKMSNAYFLLLAHDAPDATDRRMAHQAEHRGRVAASKADGHIVLGGPLLDDTTGAMTGSFMVFCLPSRQAVENWIAQDPYVTDNVWASWTIQPCGVAPLFLAASAPVA